MSNNEYISVTELNRYLYYKFEGDNMLQTVYLEGELSNFKRSGKHYYFSLKDENSEISGMFFYPSNLSLNFEPKDGMSVQVVGKVGIYQKRGTYSINVSRMTQCGLGLLYQNYLLLKAKLENEGLFKEEHKMMVPDYPETVGIITAPTGEAINDIVSTFNRRLPLAKLILYPALVQGQDAPKDLIRALKLAYQNKDIDCLIIGRGGGSFEDLNCFNDEELARLLYLAPFPTISAVGHEGDYTICDFVCSYRAPTPTGAAMRLAKDKEDVYQFLFSYAKRLKTGIKNELVKSYDAWNHLTNSYPLSHFDEIVLNKENEVDNLIHRLSLNTPENIAIKLDEKINNLKQHVESDFNHIVSDNSIKYEHLTNRLKSELVINKIDYYHECINLYDQRLNRALTQIYTDNDKKFHYLVEKATLLNPLHIIDKGYTIVYQDDQMITRRNELVMDKDIKIRFTDGCVYAHLIKKEEE